MRKVHFHAEGRITSLYEDYTKSNTFLIEFAGIRLSLIKTNKTVCFEKQFLLKKDCIACLECVIRPNFFISIRKIKNSRNKISNEKTYINQLGIKNV